MTDLTRRQRTVLLLGSRTAWHPQVRSQFATFGALPGEKATRRETCSTCHGEGETPTRVGKQPCPRCAGKGSYLVDAYTGYRSRDEGPWDGKAAMTEVEKRRQSDATIARMAAQTAPPKTEQDLIEEANLNPEPWERAREAHHAHGSYRELTLALEWLEGVSPEGWNLLRWVYELDMLRVTSPALMVRTVSALDLVNGRMPDPIRVPKWLMPRHPAQERIANRRKTAA